MTLELKCVELHEESAQLWGNLVAGEKLKEMEQKLWFTQESKKKLWDGLTNYPTIEKTKKNEVIQKTTVGSKQDQGGTTKNIKQTWTLVWRICSNHGIISKITKRNQESMEECLEILNYFPNE